jgi:hypothetical protein
MDQVTTRKLQLSDGLGQVYEEANKLFDTWQNSIVFELAKEYLENGKISPEKKVIEFLVQKGAKGFNAEANEPAESIVMQETDAEYLFPYSFEFDGTQTGCVLRIEKIKEPQPQQASIPGPVEKKPETQEDPILAARNRK